MKSTKVSHSKTKPAVLISTYPTKKSATDAEQAVKLKLAACVNTVRISSVYSWKNSTRILPIRSSLWLKKRIKS